MIDPWHPARIKKVSNREFIRRGINQHTLDKICKRVPVRTIKLVKCLKGLEEYGIESLDKGGSFHGWAILHEQ